MSLKQIFINALCDAGITSLQDVKRATGTKTPKKKATPKKKPSKAKK